MMSYVKQVSAIVLPLKFLRNVYLCLRDGFNISSGA